MYDTEKRVALVKKRIAEHRRRQVRRSIRSLSALCGVPTGGSDREPCGKLRPLSVDRDASHDRGPTVPQRRILLDVE